MRIHHLGGIILATTLFATTIFAQSEAYYALEVSEHARNILRLKNADTHVKFSVTAQDTTYRSEIFKSLDKGHYDELIAFIKDPWALTPEFRDTVIAQIQSIVPFSEKADVLLNPDAQAPIVTTTGVPNFTFPSGTSSGASQSQILWAIAETIISRAKEELATAFFKRIENYMGKTLVVYGSDNVTSAQLFPNLNLILPSLASEDISQWSNSLKTSLELDIRELPDNIYAITRDVGSLSAVLYNWTYITYSDLNNGRHPASIIPKFDPRIFQYTDAALRDVMGVVVAVNNSMIDPEQSDWMASANLNKLLRANNGLNYYGSLFYNQATTETYLDALFGKLPEITTISQKQGKVKSVAGTLAMAVSDIASALSSGRSVQPDVGEILDRSIALLRSAVETFGFNNDPSFTTGLSIAQGLSRIFTSITGEILPSSTEPGVSTVGRPNYAAAALQVLEIMGDIFGSAFTKSADYQTFVKYLTLFADMAQAQSGDEVREVLEAAILPVGSYRIKRSTAFSSSIGSLPGIAGGTEWVYSDGNAVQAGTIGGFMPLGVDLSWSGGNEQEQKGVFNVYVNILDLGHLLSYRLKNDDIAGQAPEVEFKDVFAPGLYLSYGFAKLPLTFGVGGQMAAQLRDFDNGSAVIEDSPSFALRAFFGVDIPLLSLSMRGSDRNN